MHSCLVESALPLRNATCIFFPSLWVLSPVCPRAVKRLFRFLEQEYLALFAVLPRGGAVAGSQNCSEPLWALSSQHHLVEGAEYSKSPKAFKPFDSHQNWPQAAAELLSWLRVGCALCICVVGRPGFVHQTAEMGLKQLCFQRLIREHVIDWLIEVDFSPISDQPGAFHRCDLCLLLKF